MKPSKKSIFRWLKTLLCIFGGLFILFLILAFTTLPFHWMHRLGNQRGHITKAPDIIILMGGGGMPSEDGLLRSYYAAIMAKKYPDALVYIAFPGDTLWKEDSPVRFMEELILRGIQKERIRFENSGRNTRQQAMNIAGAGIKTSTSLLLVTSPEHMLRSLLAFEKVGFLNVQGFATFEVSVAEKDLFFNDRELKGNRGIPPIGHNKQVRYQFWNHLEYEIKVIRELFALGYYKMRAWI